MATAVASPRKVDRAARRQVAVALLALASCGGCGGPPAAMLHERDAYHGRVRVHIEADGTSRRIEGELAFDRAASNYQLTFRRGGVADTLSLLPTGEVRAFRNGAPAPPNPGDRAGFEAVLRLVRQAPASDAAVQRGASGYTIATAAGRTAVELAPSDGAHGLSPRPR